jgi:hypothetical protein
MKLTKTKIAVEIAILLVVLIGVEWFASTVTRMRNVVALVVFYALYLGIRIAIVFRKPPPRKGVLR